MSMSPNHKLVTDLCLLAISEPLGIRVLTPDPQRFKEVFYKVRQADDMSPARDLTCRNCPDSPTTHIMLVKNDLKQKDPDGPG